MNRGREIWAITIKVRRLRKVNLTRQWATELASLLTQQKEKEEKSNAKTLALIG